MTPYVYSFVLMLPRPSISTLFPYTTLFRSRAEVTCGCIPPDMAFGNHTEDLCRSTEYSYLLINLSILEPRTDRKSTRLNSSHLGISYAVFCLKKKIKSIQTLSHERGKS